MFNKDHNFERPLLEEICRQNVYSLLGRH